MDRRRFLLTSVVGALVQPLAAAQQTEKLPRIGYISNSSSETSVDSAFMQGLRDLGRVDGRTIIIESRYAGARSEQLPAIARDVVSRDVDVIAAWSAPGRWSP